MLGWLALVIGALGAVLSVIFIPKAPKTKGLVMVVEAHWEMVESAFLRLTPSVWLRVTPSGSTTTPCT
ncbi:hypothetical protein K0U83_09285 [bacterium]|nr:hypothetical protein [bacterium]